MTCQLNMLSLAFQKSRALLRGDSFEKGLVGAAQADSPTAVHRPQGRLHTAPGAARTAARGTSGSIRAPFRSSDPFPGVFRIENE